MNSVLRGILALVISEGILGIMKLVLKVWQILLGVGVGYLIYMIFKQKKRRREIFKWGLISSVGVIAIGSLVIDDAYKIGVYVREYMQRFGVWIYEYLTQTYIPGSAYELVVGISIGAVISWAIYILSESRQVDGTLVAIGWISTIVMIGLYDSPNKYQTLGITIATLLWLAIEYRRSLGRYIVGNIKLSTYYINIIAAISLIIVISAIATKQLPIQLERLMNFIGLNSNRVEHRVEYHPYGGELGGVIELPDTLLFEVESRKSFYLKAETKEVYEANKWHSDIPLKERADGAFSFADTQVFLEGVQDEELIGEQDYINVKFKNIQSHLLVTPLKATNIVLPNSVENIYQVQDTYVIFKNREKDFAYRVDMYTPNFKSHRWSKVLSECKEVEDVEKVMKYTQLPDNISDRIYTLAKELTLEYDSIYKKVKVIENYLRESYTYTLSPKEIPKDKEFVDYFLFETGEGYCTYFATAMTILNRCVGIPTRYVQGYVMPNSEGNDRRTYNITGEEAHAWAEVYFEGVGWVPFEPTPSYQTISTVEEDVAYQREEISEQETQVLVSTDEVVNKGIIWMIISMMGILAIGIKIRKDKTNNESIRVKVQQEYLSFLSYLKKKYLQMEIYETDSIYIRRLVKVLKINEIEEDFLRVVELYNKATYSVLDIPKEECEEIKVLILKIKKRIK